MSVTAVAGPALGQFLAGLAIGVAIGLLLGPLLRSWLAWREWVEASKEADLAQRLLDHLEDASADQPVEEEPRGAPT